MNTGAIDPVEAEDLRGYKVLQWQAKSCAYPNEHGYATDQPSINHPRDHLPLGTIHPPTTYCTNNPITVRTNKPIHYALIGVILSIFAKCRLW